MIRDWRAACRDPNLPFGIVALTRASERPLRRRRQAAHGGLAEVTLGRLPRPLAIAGGNRVEDRVVLFLHRRREAGEARRIRPRGADEPTDALLEEFAEGDEEGIVRSADDAAATGQTARRPQDLIGYKLVLREDSDPALGHTHCLPTGAKFFSRYRAFHKLLPDCERFPQPYSVEPM